MWVEETVQATGLSIVDDLGLVATWMEVNQVVKSLEACPAGSIEWASRRDLQFDTAKTEAALFTCRKCLKKHLRPKLPSAECYSAPKPYANLPDTPVAFARCF